jgi:hypothetical protein
MSRGKALKTIRRAWRVGQGNHTPEEESDGLITIPSLINGFICQIREKIIGTLEDRARPNNLQLLLYQEFLFESNTKKNR